MLDTVIHNDCLSVLRGMADNSVDASAKVALQAVLCYNKRRNIVALAMLATSKSVTKERYFFRMDSLSPETPQKQCSNPDCKQWYPATSEFFFPDPRRKDGFKNPCKACHKARANEPVERERKRAYMKAYSQSEHGREVNRISADKPENRINKSIRDKKRRTAPEYRERQRPINRAYYHRVQNHDRIRALQKSYFDTPEGRARRNAYSRNRYATPEGKAISSVHRHIRRARKNAAPGRYTAQDVINQGERQKGKCYWCHKKLTTYHVDHIIPLSRGGSNWSDNIVLACPPCNMSKHNKLPHEWENGGRLL